ncbi:MAG: Transcriptional regulator, MarR family [Burkholderiaceae bacterium]|jgi:DNA-binding MarR family transcriptional regulator|nr:MAG: Transcriptional regulator, MarR family [Burkholderiaceae bacterium]
MTQHADAARDIPPLTAAAVEFYSPGSYFAEDSVGLLMRKTVNRLALEIERQMAPNGLTNAQWVPLLKLYLGEASTAAELARVCELDASAMTRLLDRVEAKGLCRRERSSEDRRVVSLKLTPEGREAAQKVPEVLSRVQNACLAGFTREEWQTLKDFLRRMLENTQALTAAGEPNEKQP